MVMGLWGGYGVMGLWGLWGYEVVMGLWGYGLWGVMGLWVPLVGYAGYPLKIPLATPLGYPRGTPSGFHQCTPRGSWVSPVVPWVENLVVPWGGLAIMRSKPLGAALDRPWVALGIGLAPFLVAAIETTAIDAAAI